MADSKSDGHYGLNLIVFGPPKAGKSYLGDTSPAPRVVLDAEAGSRFTPSKKKLWSPTGPPPVADGTWDTAIVPIRTFKDVSNVFTWLNSGKHPFRSVVLDSISEIQQRAAEDIAGTNQMRQQEWGTLLRVVSDLIRKYRDLVVNPIRPLDCVCFIAMAARRNGDGDWYPFMQGRLSTTLPYYTDLVAYLAPFNLEDGSQVRRLVIGSYPGYETGERVGGKLGNFIDGPNIEQMLKVIRGSE